MATTRASEGAEYGAGLGPVIARWVLAGPGVLVVAVLALGALPTLWPPGAAGVNHVAFPLVLFPAIWALLFFYVLLEERLLRAGAVLLVLGVATGIPVVRAVTSVLAAGPQGA